MRMYSRQEVVSESGACSPGQDLVLVLHVTELHLLFPAISSSGRAPKDCLHSSETHQYSIHFETTFLVHEERGHPSSKVVRLPDRTFKNCFLPTPCCSSESEGCCPFEDSSLDDLATRLPSLQYLSERNCG